MKDIDLKFVATNGVNSLDYKDNSMVPDKVLVRFKFLEILIRLVEAKYIDNK